MIKTNSDILIRRIRARFDKLSDSNSNPEVVRTMLLMVSDAKSRAPVDEGPLRNSIQWDWVGKSDKAITYRVGSRGVVYAAQREFGGVIVPVKGNWLTIPTPRAPKGLTARDMPDLFRISTRGGRASGPAGGLALARDVGGRLQIMFWLRQRVEQEGKPYITPAVDAHLPRLRGALTGVIRGD